MMDIWDFLNEFYKILQYYQIFKDFDEFLKFL